MENNINLKKVSKGKIEINIDKDFCISGVTKIIESSADKIILKMNNQTINIDGKDLDLFNIDIENKLIKGVGKINRLKMNKRNLFK